MAQSDLTAAVDESKKEWGSRHINVRQRDNFERKAWMQEDRSSNTWVWTCLNMHCGLNARHFPVVVQTYFGVRQECLNDLVGLDIRQRSGGGREERRIE